MPDEGISAGAAQLEALGYVGTANMDEETDPFDWGEEGHFVVLPYEYYERLRNRDVPRLMTQSESPFARMREESTAGQLGIFTDYFSSGYDDTSGVQQRLQDMEQDISHLRNFQNQLEEVQDSVDEDNLFNLISTIYAVSEDISEYSDQQSFDEGVSKTVYANTKELLTRSVHIPATAGGSLAFGIIGLGLLAVGNAISGAILIALGLFGAYTLKQLLDRNELHLLDVV